LHPFLLQKPFLYYAGSMIKLQLIYYIPTIILSFLLGLIVFLNNRKRLTNRTFLLLTVSILAWLFTQFVADTSVSNSVALFFIRATICVSLIIGVAFVFLIDALVENEKFNKRLWVTCIVILMVLIPVAFLNTTVVSVTERPWGAEAQYGITYLVFLAYSLSIFAYTLYLAFYKKTNKTPRARVQIRYVYFGIATTLSVNVLSNFVLLQFGLPQQLGVALGIVSVLFIVGFTGFAVIRHRLFDIRAVVARSLAYVFSIAVFASLYAFLTFGLAQGVIFSNVLTTERSQQIFNIILAVILAFTFPTIRRFFEKITDRVFYRDRYDPQLLISSVGRVLASEIRLDQLSKQVIHILEDQMRITDANIVVLGELTEDELEAKPAPESAHHHKPKTSIYYQTHSSKLHQAYHLDDLSTIRLPILIADELAVSDEREMLERHHIRAALTLKTREAFVGYLLLGDKRSGDIYSTQDIQTLRIISNELAVAIQNARSYTEIQRFNETLREKIKQATADLTHANHELKALDKAKDEFISMASHQLRTPLTAVRGYTSMVMDGDFGKISGEQKDTLKQSFDAATRMTRLVDDLLNVSRIQSGKFRIERAEVDLNKVLPEELSLLETTAGTKRVKMSYHAPKQPVPNIMIDEGKTRQCLMNLMDNAVYYSSPNPDGGQVQVYLENDEKHVIFRVVDNGIGVPRDQQNKLFKKFYRAPNAQNARPDGTGLGLFLVGKVVHDQGGEIIFESVEGKGSTFGFKLPLKPAGEGLADSKKASPVEEAVAKRKVHA